MVGISTPSNPTVPARYSPTETNSMTRSKTKITVLADARLTPAVRFIRASSWDSASVWAFISASRAVPCPYGMVSGRPRRLSSTKALSSPDLVRNFSPSSPLSLDVASGTMTPTVMYAASASRPSAQWKEPMNRHKMTVNSAAMAMGEMVCA